ncbi:MAG: DEAD/DEAH box helicase [Planctomycetes bacterium]|nr:DEAD/DEAH box helicase [Planctomycetota bacterium]
MSSTTDDSTISFSLRVTPAGHVSPSRGDGFGYPLERRLVERIEAAFDRGMGHGLLHLGAEETTADLGSPAGWWRDVARLYFTKLSTILDLEAEIAAGLRVPLDVDEEERLLAAAPPMLGIEYLSEDVLRSAWAAIERSFLEDVRASGLGAEAYLHARNPLWKSVGRVFLHLAENKARPDRPFAFLATYTSRLSAQGKIQHVPLGRAVKEQSAAANRKALLSLLVPLQRAAEESEFLRELVDSGRVFHPQAWSPEEAHRFLRDAAVFEKHGIYVQIPDWWNVRSPPRVQVNVTVGRQEAAGLGADALLDFSVDLSLEGEAVTPEEWREILAGSGNLALVKGRWVELDREKLRDLLSSWSAIEKQAGNSGMSFRDAMRLLAGWTQGKAAAPGGEPSGEAAADEWVSVRAGEWLRGVLDELRAPGGRESSLPAGALRATLRPYQEEGVRWLWLLHRLRLGGCLADDMGLGKTIQVLGLLILIQKQRKEKPKPLLPPGLIVVPASLIANWKSEFARFAPGLRLLVAHPSEGGGRLDKPPPGLSRLDAVITTYGMLARLDWIRGRSWGLVVLDEAQAIKNPSARQTRAAKAIPSIHRLALTGTPVENRLADLWSLFEFLQPGLLGGAKEFSRLTGKGQGSGGDVYSRLRALVRPYILRRLKTDKRVIADLPDKQEMKVHCGLRKLQAVLYQQAVDELARTLGGAEGVRRRGVILAFLMRFKQICNHPSQWRGDGSYDPSDSGKMLRLLELCEEIASRQEKALVFTQFRELTSVLASALEPVFGRSGVILDGSTPVKRRRQIVDAFQREDGPPFFVLSLKAGGTGLNLTAASHVIHFDRWWNPAVENQATDRAYRIGQRKNVLVHKFVCQGTVEEKIDAMLESKREMSEEILKAGAEAALTEMGDEELMRLVTLDTNRVLTES